MNTSIQTQTPEETKTPEIVNTQLRQYTKHGKPRLPNYPDAGPKETLVKTDTVEIKLTLRQKRALEALTDPRNVKLSIIEKARKARVSSQYIYALLKNPDFLNALKLYKLSIVHAISPQIIHKASKDALDGNFNQQRMLLEMSGDYQPHSEAVQINQVIANMNKTGMDEKELDNKLSEYFGKK